MRAAGTAAMSCVDETKVVASGAPFQVTAVEATNPVPLAVRVNVGPPAATLEGEMLVSISEFEIVKGSDAGRGDPVTLTAAVSAAVSRFTGTEAVSCDAETKVVANGELFQITLVPDWNPDPFTVRVNAEPPIGAEFGDRLINVIGG